MQVRRFEGSHDPEQVHRGPQSHSPVGVPADGFGGTASSALEKARLRGSIQRQQQDVQEKGESAPPTQERDLRSGDVDSVARRKKAPAGVVVQRRKPDQLDNFKSVCVWCGGTTHIRPSCPARTAKCYNCGKRGHFAGVYKKGTSDSRKLRVSAVAEDSDTYFVGALSDASRERSAKFAHVCTNGVSLTAKIDSSAEVTAIPASFPGIPRQLQTAHEILRGPSDQILHVTGKFMAETTRKEKKSQQCVYVIDSLHAPLLGLPALESLGIVKFMENVTCSKNIEKQFPQIFRGLGTIEGDHTHTL